MPVLLLLLLPLLLLMPYTSASAVCCLTRQPFSPRARAMARPMPLEPPVTRHTGPDDKQQATAADADTFSGRAAAANDVEGPEFMSACMGTFGIQLLCASCSSWWNSITVAGCCRIELLLSLPW
jgi:hypothetical protein